MNDFTKYELKSLLWSIEYTRERTNNCGDAMRLLEPKIQSMIDNYCEHEEEKIIGERMNYYSGKCKKCGEFYI